MIRNSYPCYASGKTFVTATGNFVTAAGPLRILVAIPEKWCSAPTLNGEETLASYWSKQSFFEFCETRDSVKTFDNV